MRFELSRTAFAPLPTHSEPESEAGQTSRRKALTKFSLGLAGLFVLIAFPTSALAQRARVTTIDGLRYEGRLWAVKEYDTAFKPEDYQGRQILIIDNGLTRTFINSRKVPPDNLGESQVQFDEFEIYQNSVGSGGNPNFPPILRLSPFNKFGRRTLTVADGSGKTYIQGITRITPEYVVVSGIQTPGKSVNFNMRLATSSIAPSVIEHLLHLQVSEPGDLLERERLVAFFIRANMLDQAAAELADLKSDFPGQDFERITLELNSSIHRRSLDEIRFRFEANQVELARELWDVYNKSDLPATIAAEFLEMREKLDTQLAQNNQAVATVRTLVEAAAKSGDLNPAQLRTLDQFVAELEADINETNILRLSTFSRFANDETQNLMQRLAYALSGWYLGSAEAINNFGLAESLPKTRQLIREYLAEADEGRRAAILAELQTMESGAPQYLAQIIGNMSPPLPVEELSNHKPIRLEITAALPQGESARVPYWVQLPPEYDPHRRYPCIVALPTTRQDAQLEIDWWCGQYLENLKVHSGPASRHGYIVISPQLYAENQRDYEYSVTEHDIVLSAYRSAIKRFSIDTDRVFLAGHFRGGDAAWDIGLAHPDLWAGVITISGVAKKYVEYYFRNAGNQNLPFYCVIGDRDLAVRNQETVTTLNNWLRSSRFDVTLVEYLGRANEHFYEDIDNIFLWMKTKRRKWIPSQLEAKSLRPTDNFFWNIEVGDIPEKHVVAPKTFDAIDVKGGSLTFSVEMENRAPNSFIVRPTRSGGHFSFWLGPEFIDFDKPVQIIGRGDFSEAVQPSRKILLEDVRLRGDRQHPFWAKLYAEQTRWEITEDY